MRVLIEVLHIVVGLLCAVIIASLSIWAYPQARQDIWIVAGGAMVAVVLMGIGPTLAAYREDQARLKGGRVDV